MEDQSTQYLIKIRQLLIQHFSLAEIKDLCFLLNVDFDTVSGDEKSSKITELIIGLARSGRIQELVAIAQKQRQNVDWPARPERFQLPTSLNLGGESIFSKPDSSNSPIPWEQVVEVIREKNRKHSEILDSKYNSDLYVERTKLREQINQFMDSKEAVFLILEGRSGMGKTAFLSTLEKEFSHDPNIACLVFDCKSLRVVDRVANLSLLDSLAKGRLPPPNQEVITNLVSRIQSGDGFNEKYCRLVIIADALNESKNAASILKWLVNLQSGDLRIWIKVIISCRPHILLKIRDFMNEAYSDSSYALSSKYFYRTAKVNRPFLEMPNFTENEARDAYQKHQLKFNLTPRKYDDLKNPQVKERLKEPLLLWLIANICDDTEGSINEKMSVDSLEAGTDLSIIPDYTRIRLKKAGCVDKEEQLLRRFLEQKLPYEMIYAGKCRNTVPIQEVTEIIGENYKNRLLRLGLLEETAAGSIGFRYERFYDYYFGLELHRQFSDNPRELGCHPADDWIKYVSRGLGMSAKGMIAEAYWDLIERMGEGCYYLWGPIQNALLLEFLDGNEELLARIILEGPLVEGKYIPTLRKDLLIQILVIAGQEDKKKVSNFLYSIATEDSRWKQLGNRQSWLETKKAVTYVSSSINAQDPLLVLLLDKEEEVRRAAVGATFKLWLNEKENGKNVANSSSFEILKKIGAAEEFSRWLFPSRQRFRSCFELSISFLFEDYTRADVTNFLLNMWEDITKKVFWHSERGTDSEDSFSWRINNIIRTAILKVIVNVVIAISKNLEEKNKMSVFNFRAIDDFFNSKPKTKKRFSDLVPYIDSREGNLQDIKIKEDLKAIAQSRDLFPNYLFLIILGARINSKPKETTKLMKELLPDLMKFEPGLPSIPMINIALSGGSDGKEAEEIDPNILELSEDVIKQYQELHDSICEVWRRSSLWETIRHRSRRKELKYIHSGLSSYPQYAKKKYNDVNAHGILDFFINRAKKKNSTYYDVEKIRNYIDNVAIPGHPDYRNINAILEALDPVIAIAFSEELPPDEMTRALKEFQKYGLQKTLAFMHAQNNISRKQKELIVFQQNLEQALALIKVYAPDEVEEYMADHNLPRDFRKRVNRRASEEPLAPAVKGRSVFFIRDKILLKPDSELARMFRSWFAKAPNSKSLSHWISQGLMDVLNALSGAELFKAGASEEQN